MLSLARSLSRKRELVRAFSVSQPLTHTHPTPRSITVQDGRLFGFEKPAQNFHQVAESGHSGAPSLVHVCGNNSRGERRRARPAHVADLYKLHSHTETSIRTPPRALHQVISAEQRVAQQRGESGDGTIVNVFSWYGFDQDMVDRFVERYGAFLAEFDGFIVTHTPVFVRLFESFGKPIILVNTCRYDQPFCYNGNDAELQTLHACLRNLRDRGLLIAISNNRADQDYLRLGADIASVRIPSLCLYTGVSVCAGAHALARSRSLSPSPSLYLSPSLSTVCA